MARELTSLLLDPEFKEKVLRDLEDKTIQKNLIELMNHKKAGFGALIRLCAENGYAQTIRQLSTEN